MKKKVLLLANVKAGTGTGRSRMAEIIETLANSDCEVTVYPLDPGRNLVSENVLENKLVDPDFIMCCGGDGTLNHLINVMKKLDIEKPICYYPTGSANDFARNIYGNDISVARVCDALTSGRPFPYDIGRFNDNYFNYVAAFGAFTRVSYATPVNMKNSLGYLAYVLNVLGDLPDSLNYRVRMKVECDGQLIEGEYIVGAISNSRSIGGMQPLLLSDAALDDGLMELILISAPNNIIDTSNIVNNLLSGNVDGQYITVIKGSHVVIDSEKTVAWTLDGEAGGEHDHVTIDNVHHGMTVMA